MAVGRRAGDLKSLGREAVRVQIPPRAPFSEIRPYQWDEKTVSLIPDQSAAGPTSLPPGPDHPASDGCTLTLLQGSSDPAHPVLGSAVSQDL